MNLIKLNPLKKLMLVVLSWFVHAVYHVDCFAWTAVACPAASNCVAEGNCNEWRESCCGSGYGYQFNGASLNENDLFVYRTYNAASLEYPNTTMVCITETERVYLFKGSDDRLSGYDCCSAFDQGLDNFGNCNAFLDSAQLSGGKRANVGALLHESTLSVTNDKIGGVYVGNCHIAPGGYVSYIHWLSTMAHPIAGMYYCPAGYYCPGGPIGTFIFNASGISAGKGRYECGAGYYCSSRASSRTPCPIGSYSSSATATSCSTCPSHSGVAGTTAGTATQYLSLCYIPAGAGMPASGGHTIAFISNCYYS